MTILSMGPKFATTPAETPILEFASEVEAIISQELPEQSQRQARGETMFDYQIFKTTQEAESNRKVSTESYKKDPTIPERKPSHHDIQQR